MNRSKHNATVLCLEVFGSNENSGAFAGRLPASAASCSCLAGVACTS